MSSETPAGLTFELSLRFGADRRLKDALLAWLEARGVTDYAEGVIDGVDLAADAEALAALIRDGSDTAPVSVYGFDRAALVQLEAEALHAFRQYGLKTVVAEIKTESWNAAWESGFEALVTRRFRVQPLGGGLLANPAAEGEGGRILIELKPGSAFGAGDHATTAAALMALEDVWDELGSRRDLRLLDVGTGTGILAIAAAKLGFASVQGTDIDPEALKAAAENCALNGVAMGLVLAAAPPPEMGRFAVIAANILVPVLHELLPRLAALLTPGGRLVLAGFIGKERDALAAAGALVGLTVASEREVRGWLGVVLAKPAIPR